MNHITSTGPFWGNVTSTIDWCEENYAVSQFVAEFYNATSNIVFLILPTIGVITVLKTRAEHRYAIAYALLSLVGAGSALFHGTLRHGAQLLDELPMVALSVTLLSALTQTISPAPKLALILTIAGIIESIVYVKTNGVLFFQLCFCALTLTHVGIALQHAKSLSSNYTNIEIGSTLKRLLITEISAGALAGICWIIDYTACSALQTVREASGLTITLQLHAAWHVLTGLAGYVAIVLAQYMRSNYRKQSIKVKWLLGVIPIIVDKKKELVPDTRKESDKKKKVNTNTKTINKNISENINNRKSIKTK